MTTLNRKRTLRPNAKLSDADVIAARKRYFAGLTTTRDLAIEHDVGMETMRRALRGDTFAHLYHENAKELGRVNPIDEPTEEDHAAALSRLMAVQQEVAKAEVPDGSKLIAEMMQAKAPEARAAMEKWKREHPEAKALGPLVEAPEEPKGNLLDE